MPAGADKIIAFDPPGGIGLPADDAIVLLRFNEPVATLRPVDTAANLTDMDVTAGLGASTVVAGAMGPARHFNAGITSGLVATDRVSGSTLLTRDMTIQLIARWVAADQVSYGTNAVAVQRGLGHFVSAAETVSYGLGIDFTGLPAGQGKMMWLWETVAGTLVIDTVGGVFVSPTGFTLLTATRRWVSPTSSVVRYYIGDTLLAENIIASGDIGGSTLGTFQVGSVHQSAGAGFGRTFQGDIDELLIVDRELTREEIEFTWLRITKYQPLGVQTYLEMHDQGFPMPTDPGSDVQLEARLIGNALGYAAAQAENLRANALPGRSYGSTLADWETVARVTPAPVASIDQRRARVVARISQRRGVSIGGLEDALVGLLGGAPDTALQFLAFDAQWQDDFASIDAHRWLVLPSGAFSIVSGKARFSGSGDLSASYAVRNWMTMATPVQAAVGAHILTELTMVTPQSGLESGIYIGGASTGNYILLGLRDDAGTFKVVIERFLAWSSQGVVTLGTLGANPAAIWLHLQQSSFASWVASWSITGRTAGYSSSGTISHPGDGMWAANYVRSFSAVGASVVDFNNTTLFVPGGTMAFNAYVFLDAALGFHPDVEGADSVLQAIKHAYTVAAFIQRKSFILGESISQLGRTPMGAL